MLFRTLDELDGAVRPALACDRQGVREVLDGDALRACLVDRLAYNAVFQPDVEIKSHVRFLIRSAAARLGIFPASLHALYAEKSRGRHTHFTVPAVNLRALTFDGARAVFEAARELDAGAFIFEIARSEVAYSDQWPSEYAAVVLAAAIKTGFRGPLFLLGDHFQVRAASFFNDPELEIEAIKLLVGDALRSGFFNIDIDASTLVDLRKENLTEQQRLNYELTATFTHYIRRLEPAGTTVAVGGEIGEVGGKNSTVEELEAFMEGYRLSLDNLERYAAGLSKISVQTGTTHGGVPLPDGSVARVNLDFQALAELSRTARKGFGLAGAVQHGASTLPAEMFHCFPEAGAAEIHLATAFQNLLFEHPKFPAGLRAEIYDYLREQCARWRRDGQTDEQFLYKNRKRALKPFKRRLWDLPEEIRAAVRGDMKSILRTMFEQLGVSGTRALVEACTHPPEWPVSLAQERELAK
jgi:fructose/tagatose bisphosphate aldolase